MKNRIRNSENRIRNSDKELMQQALDALESVFEGDDKGAEYWTVTGGTYEAVECMNAMRALRARLAQPEQEPVAWTVRGLITDFSRDFSAYQTKTYTVPLYTDAPQHEWQGLTDEEYESMAEKYVTNCYFDTLKYARAIEVKLKEKNGFS
jgi:hypothetical protein